MHCDRDAVTTTQLNCTIITWNARELIQSIALLCINNNMYINIELFDCICVQTKFKAEVLSPYEGRQAVYQDLRSKLQLLPDKQSAEESFKKFEEVASIIEG